MIHKLLIQGVGPHVDTRLTLNPRGWSEVVGPSEAGKSTLCDAVALALWGEERGGSAFPVEGIAEGEAGARSRVTLANGAAFQREVLVHNGARDVRRLHIGKDGVETAPPTDKEWWPRLGVLGARRKALRVVMFGGWESLHPRALRDLLVEAACGEGGDLRPIVKGLMASAGFELRDGDPADEKGAYAARTHAKSEAAKATGARDELAKLLAIAKARVPATVAQADVDAARELLSVTVPAWHDFNRRQAEHDYAAQQHRGFSDRLAVWTAAHDALGVEPAHDEDEYSQASRVAWALNPERSKVAAADARRVLERAQRDLKLAEESLADLWRTAACDDDTCPTCKRPGWTAKQDAARHDVPGAERALAERQSAVEKATLSLSDAEASARADVLEHAKAQELFDALVARRASWQKWHADMRALGPRPAEPAIPPMPVPPAPAEPAGMDVFTAEETLQAAERAKGAADTYAREVQAIAQRLGTAELEATRRAERVAYLEALVDATRHAPTALLDTFGELGPVTLQPVGDGGVEVLVDGRRWNITLAVSDGARVVADLWLRAGIRTAMRMPYLPIFVDRAQDVAGKEWPPIPGPVVLLRTADGAGLTVNPW